MLAKNRFHYLGNRFSAVIWLILRSGGMCIMRKLLFFWLMIKNTWHQTKLYKMSTPKCQNKRDSMLKPKKFGQKNGSNLWGTVLVPSCCLFWGQNSCVLLGNGYFFAQEKECQAPNPMIYNMCPKVPEQKRYDIKTEKYWTKKRFQSLGNRFSAVPGLILRS